MLQAKPTLVTEDGHCLRQGTVGTAIAAIADSVRSIEVTVTLHHCPLVSPKLTERQ